MAGNKVSETIVTESQNGQRVDNFLLARIKGVPKSRLYRALRNGEVRVNGKRIKPSYRLSTGERVRMPPLRQREPSETPVVPKPWRDKLRRQIIFKNDDIMVVNKPAGMAVHAGTGVEYGLIEGVKGSSEWGPEWELVHRLDRETSGCLVLARQGAALTELHEVFRSRAVNKGYLLWVAGSWSGGERWVERPLIRTMGRGGERMVTEDAAGQAARTRFRPLLSFQDRSLLWASPETGRTHQIRAHAAMEGFPIIGDTKYGLDAANTVFRERFGKRLFLHAASLVLPYRQQELAICALPDRCWYGLGDWSHLLSLNQ